MYMYVYGHIGDHVWLCENHAERECVMRRVYMYFQSSIYTMYNMYMCIHVQCTLPYLNPMGPADVHICI